MIMHPDIDPVFLHLGPLELHWYGLMYVLGISGTYLYLLKQHLPLFGTKQGVENAIFFATLGLLFGGRIGYMLIYQLPFLLAEPLSLFRIWEGGMSFHGGLLGALIGLYYYSRVMQRPFLAVTDALALITPLGLCFGRIGNFINGELPGRVTDLPWGMVFQHYDSLPRHPSQLYEAVLEGPLLFCILWIVKKQSSVMGLLSAMFLCAYSLMRFLVEFFRLPDPQMGFIIGILTTGQCLSILMFSFGVMLLGYSLKKKQSYAHLS